MCLKTEQLSIQTGINNYGHKGRQSAMKEIRNLSEKSECFGEVDYDKIRDGMMKKALPLLMVMEAKRNGNIKTRGVANISGQRLHTCKLEHCSPMPDFCTFKHVCRFIAKKDRETATADLPRFFCKLK